MLSCIVGNLNARFKKDKEYMEKKSQNLCFCRIHFLLGSLSHYILPFGATEVFTLLFGNM